MSISFFKEPTAVVEYLQAKDKELHFDYDEIAYEAHHRVFTVAKITNIDLLGDIKTSLEDAYKSGKSFETWKDEITPTLKKRGWFGHTTVTNPKTGEEKEIYVGSKRLKNIYNTNMRTAYAKARYETQMESTGEYFRYTAVMDMLTRPSHARLHGTVLPKNDPFWDTNYPPNGWGCRCKVQVLTKSELERRGITPLADGSMLPNIAHKDFAYNPGKVDKLNDILKKKADSVLNTSSQNSPVLPSLEKFTKNFSKNMEAFDDSKDIYTWQKELDTMVKAVTSGIIIKDKAFQIAQVGKLKPNITKSLKEQGITPKAQSISIYQDTISHITRDSKPKHKEPNIDEIRAIVGVLDSAKHVFYDTQRKNLLYFYPSMQDDGMVNYVAVNLDYTLKKFKTDNFVATISKMPKINYRDITKNKSRYKKIK